MRGRKRRVMTEAEIRSWIEARIEITTAHALLHVHKYDNGIVTKDDMMFGVKEEVRRMAGLMYDTGFTDGVNGSVDVEDEDNPVALEIEEDDDEDEAYPR